MHLDQCHNHCNDHDIDQDNCDDDGDHISVDDDDKDEKDSVVKGMTVHNKGALLPFLWVPTIAPASNHQIHKSPTNIKKFIFWKMNTY